MDCSKKYPSAEQRKELEPCTLIWPLLANTKYHRVNLSTYIIFLEICQRYIGVTFVPNRTSPTIVFQPILAIFLVYCILKNFNNSKSLPGQRGMTYRSVRWVLFM